jgi:hypothetical protein
LTQARYGAGERPGITRWLNGNPRGGKHLGLRPTAGHSAGLALPFPGKIYFLTKSCKFSSQVFGKNDEMQYSKN